MTGYNEYSNISQQNPCFMFRTVWRIICEKKHFFLYISLFENFMGLLLEFSGMLSILFVRAYIWVRFTWPSISILCSPIILEYFLLGQFDPQSILNFMYVLFRTFILSFVRTYVRPGNFLYTWPSKVYLGTGANIVQKCNFYGSFPINLY